MDCSILRRSNSREHGASMEKDCGIVHLTIEDAIRHAEQGMGGRASEPFWGRGYRPLRPGESRVDAKSVPNLPVARVTVTGFQINNLKRWRLDYDDEGVHVNEEDFTREVGRQKPRHKVRGTSFLLVDTYWRKWTAQATGRQHTQRRAAPETVSRKPPPGIYVVLGIQADNLLGNRNYIGFGSVAGSPTYGQPLGAVPGRSVRVSLT